MTLKEKVQDFWDDHKKKIAIGVSVSTIVGMFFVGAIVDEKLIYANWKTFCKYRPELNTLLEEAKNEYILDLLNKRFK